MPSTTPQSADLLIEARWVLPVAPEAAALAHHAVAIGEGRILAVGPAAELAARFTAREHITRPGHALLPGLVNAHTRAGRTLLRGRPARTSRQSDESWTTAELVRDSTQLAVAEMLLGGITSFATRDLYPEEVARVAASARMRASIGLPVAEGPTAWAESLTGHLDKAERLWDEYPSDPWVRFHFAPDAAHLLSDAALARVRTVADELDARLTLPVHETEHEIRDGVARHALSPIRRLAALGLLRPGFVALHLSRLEQAELELLARTGISAVACPQATLRRGLGLCRLTELLNRGIDVALGTGSPTAAFALDMLAEARTASLLASSLEGVRDALGAERALALATLGGAAALGLKSLVGSIEPGKAADLIAIDLSSIACRPEGSPAEAVLFAASRDRVSDVWINGSPRVAQGRLLAFDEQELLAVARRWEERLS
ncbi:MAG: amidohydrolase family protein [Steroidobacteraceae bacterium]